MSNEEENLKTIIKEIAFIVITALLLYYGLTFGLSTVLNTKTPIMVVVSGSMKPTININDLIIVKGVDPTTLNKNDIIVFRNPSIPPTSEYNQYIVHRIIEVISKNPPKFKTKGDANLSSDPFIVNGDHIIGKVIYIIPQLGIVTRIFKPPFNYITIVLILIIYLIYEANEIFKTKGETL